MTLRPRDFPAAAWEPRYALAWAILACALATLALAYPALGGGFLVSPMSDQYIGGYPVREFAASSLRAGAGFPQWNPYLYGGLPYIAAMHGDIFYPTFLLRLLMPVDAAMTWSFILHIFLAGVFTFVFLRSWGLGFAAALVGGLAYQMSGPIASYVAPGHDGKLYVSALLPLALFLLVRGVRDGRLWAFGLFAITIGLGVLSPHPQLLQYLLLTCGAFALYLARSGQGSERLDGRTQLRRLGLALGGVVLGFLMGAVQYYPVLQYIEWSPRSGGRGYDYATSFSMPLSELLNMYLPQFTGILDRYWGHNGIHFHSEYLGAAVLVLAGAAFGGLERRGFRRFWLGALVVSVLWALGGSTPFYQLIYVLVPGSKFFRAPSTILYVVAFSTAVLAALGAERALARQLSPRYLAGWGIVALVVALLATTGGLTSLAASIADPQLYSVVQSNHSAVVGGAWRSLVFVGLAVGLLLAVRRGRLSAPLATAGLLVILTLDLWSVLRMYWLFSPPASELYASDPTLDYVRAQPEPGRVLAIPLSNEIAPHDPFVTGDAPMVHDIRLVTGYHGNEIGRYQRLVRTEGALQNQNFYALTNARYLLTNAEVPELERLVGPVRNAAGTQVWLYRLPGDNPPAWVTPLIVKADDESVLATVLDPRFDLRTAALFDSGAAVRAPAAVQALPAPLTGTRVSVTRYEPGQIDLTISGPVPDGAALVVSENYYPGWRATVNGAAAPVGRADFTFIGVPIGPGARTIQLRFTDESFRTGAIVTLLAVGTAVLLSLGGLLADRRRRG